MASIFTYDPNPPRVSSPWSTPGSLTPQPLEGGGRSGQISAQNSHRLSSSPSVFGGGSVSKLEAEPQEGSTEYKLHLLLRPRRKLSYASTGYQIPGSQHSKPYLTGSGFRPDSSTLPARPAQAPSTQSRQTRLQQLTTQLLWRLQQSSPFHSSSTATLVLPALPEATPTLGIPNKPSKLLPGLEESQGALYEIGVSDDGSFIGLTEDEMDESLINLEAMAASLGCVIEVLRKVVVGDCEWSESDLEKTTGKTYAEKLWVAEALVRPDLEWSSQLSRSASSLQFQSQKTLGSLASAKAGIVRSETEQLRVSITGPSTSGKSSLLGTLSTSTLDNGRGKSRLSLLKHRHEIATGVTSSVAQELIGYQLCSRTEVIDENIRNPAEIINYASGNVSSWIDIHGLAERLVFLSDSPGLPRFSKSTIRTLLSWRPHWTLFCLAADDAEDQSGDSGIIGSTRIVPELSAHTESPTTSRPTSDMSLSHLKLGLRLGLPLLVVITKMDVATRFGLRQTLAKLLSAVKAGGRKPIMLNTNAATSSQASTTPFSMSSLGNVDLGVNLQHISVADQVDVQRVAANLRNDHFHIVPIVLTSAVTGAGIGKLHALLRTLPIPRTLESENDSQKADANMDKGQCSPSKLFHIDEVFGMPPSKVYSPSIQESSGPDQGVVLCGQVAKGCISIGDEISIGPFTLNVAGEAFAQLRSLHRSSSYPDQRPQSLAAPRDVYTSSADFSKSPILNISHRAKRPSQDSHAVFLPVRVVSIRNLRLPVRSLLADQVGTIGVEPLQVPIHDDNISITLRRARRGMVVLTTSPSFTPVAFRSFVASFPSSDFAPTAASPPLILGGHAIAYINSIRAATRVTAVALAEIDLASGSGSPAVEMFGFDSEDDDTDREEQGPGGESKNGVAYANGSGSSGGRDEEIRITFRFVSSVEWMQVGNKVLVVPTATAAMMGSANVAGPNTLTGGGGDGLAIGLSGFVGRICERPM